MTIHESQKEICFVAGVHSLVTGHKLEYGRLSFVKTIVSGPCSVHAYGYLAGLDLASGITITNRSSIEFAKNVVKAKSGVYHGVPARECIRSK
jgi:hypothetical protein